MISHKRKHDRQEGEQQQVLPHPATPLLKTPKDSSEDDSPISNSNVNATTSVPGLTIGQVLNPTNTSTPLSSLSAEHFLARKRGRPPKKIVSKKGVKHYRFPLSK